MDLRRFAPDDHDALLGWVEVHNASRSHETPWEHPLTEHEARGLLRHGWDGEPSVPWLGTVDGVAVAAGAYEVSERDNLHLAWLEVVVSPGRRSEGHGAAMLRHLEAEVAALGRTSLGLACWDLAVERAPVGFAVRHGYTQGSVEVNRRQYLADVDDAAVDDLHDRARAASADYELVRFGAHAPDADLAALAVMTEAINDAPHDDLDIDDVVFDAARVRAYEDAQAGRGLLLHRLVARHRPTGELAGQTVVVVDQERPHLAEQHDTSVLAAHRGHRLGALLKSGMLQWLREEQPQVTEIDTWNAESNSFMIGVNEALGYRVMGRVIDLQKAISGSRPPAP